MKRKLRTLLGWLILSALLGMLGGFAIHRVRWAGVMPSVVVIQPFTVKPSLDRYGFEHPDKFFFWTDIVGTSDFFKKVGPGKTIEDQYIHSSAIRYSVQEGCDLYMSHPHVAQFRMIWQSDPGRESNDSYWVARFQPAIDEFVKLATERGLDVTLKGKPYVKYRRQYWPSSVDDFKELFLEAGLPSVLAALVILLILAGLSRKGRSTRSPTVISEGQGQPSDAP